MDKNNTIVYANCISFLKKDEIGTFINQTYVVIKKNELHAKKESKKVLLTHTHTVEVKIFLGRFCRSQNIGGIRVFPQVTQLVSNGG